MELNKAWCYVIAFSQIKYQPDCSVLEVGGKLLLIINRKSHIGFRLVPKSVNFNDLERRNGHVVRVISPNSVTFAPIT